jgi:hypothetical protein
MKVIEKVIFVGKADGIRSWFWAKVISIFFALTLSDPLSGFHGPSTAPAHPALKAFIDGHEATFNVLEKQFLVPGAL